MFCDEVNLFRPETEIVNPVIDFKRHLVGKVFLTITQLVDLKVSPSQKTVHRHLSALQIVDNCIDSVAWNTGRHEKSCCDFLVVSALDCIRVKSDSQKAVAIVWLLVATLF